MDSLIQAIVSNPANAGVLISLLFNVMLFVLLRAEKEQCSTERDRAADMNERMAESIDRLTDALTEVRITLAERG